MRFENLERYEKHGEFANCIALKSYRRFTAGSEKMR